MPALWPQSAMSVAYDRPVDVLHITVGPLVPYEGDGLPGGVELDFSLDDGAPCGAKVIGFQKNGWIDRVPKLAKLIGKHLGVPASTIEQAILDATA